MGDLQLYSFHSSPHDGVCLALDKLGKCSKKTPRINQIIIPFLPRFEFLDSK